MSELKLSVPLIQSIQKLIVDTDPEARDGMVTAQYLSAVMGFLVGSQKLAAQAKREAMDELCDFARYVMQDVDSQAQSAAAAPTQEALGVWRPGDP
jgi:hypothetical protein